MKLHISIVVMLIIFLSGCQTALRKYDGVLGYKIISNVEGRVLLSYVDEERRSWDDIKKRALLACAYELKNDPKNVIITVLKQQQFPQYVNMPLSIPIATAPSSGSKINGTQNTGTIAIDSKMDQSLMINMNLKSLTAECRGS
ncbi:MAG: hypothetical protein Q7U16_12075 [Agitococcus sp.]|nr:hypothetical protein [Agitococcus sp.]